MEKIKSDIRYKYTLLGTFLTGLFAHGFILTNKISFHDDICSLYKIGYTWKMGRWTSGILQGILSNSIGKYSMPFFEGILSIIFVAISACLLIDIFEVSDRYVCLVIGGLLITFPVTAGVFQYMFMASIYFAALFLSVFAIWLVGKCRFGSCAAVICIALSLGIYQAFYAVGITILIFAFLKKLKEENFYDLCRLFIRYLVVEIAGLLFYFGIVKLALLITGEKLAGYQGADTMMKLSLIDRLQRVRYCYRDVIDILYKNVDGVNPNAAIRLVIGFLLVGFVFLLFRYMKQLILLWKKLFVIIVALILPIGVNLIYLMTTEKSDVHTLMRYPLVFLWLAPFLIMSIEKTYINRLLKRTVLGLGGISIFLNIYFDNSVYLKMNFLQEQTSAYYTTLITQIKSCEGYKDEYPVCYIGMGMIEDQTITHNEEYQVDGFEVWEYDLAEWINNYAYFAYMSNHCGFKPTVIEQSELNAEKEIKDMPVYPDAGAIRVINQVVVVKFAE